MATQEWTHYTHYAPLDVGLLHAFYTQHAYPRHSHDYYVISVVERGPQSFIHNGARLYTPPGGLILINPDEAHTGETADEHGFELRSLYPRPAVMQRVVEELTGRAGLPFFTTARADDPDLRRQLLALHRALLTEADPLECETRFFSTVGALISRYAEVRPQDRFLGRERQAVQQVRRTIEARFAEGLHLQDLADGVALSPYYLLRVFRAEVGMPPYTYLESVRIRHAQRRLEAGQPLADVAYAVGFSSQSHFTRDFKRIIGVTPGEYARHSHG